MGSGSCKQQEQGPASGVELKEQDLCLVPLLVPVTFRW